MSDYQSAVDVLCGHAPIACAAVRKLRARLSAERKLRSETRRWGLAVVDGWLKFNADPTKLGRVASAPVHIETGDVWRSAKVLEGAWLIRRRITDIGGRTRHCYLPLITQADIEAAQAPAKPGRKAVKRALAA